MFGFFLEMFVSLKYNVQQTGCVSVKDRRFHNFEDDVGNRVKICLVCVMSL